MPLNASGLAQALERIFQAPPSSTPQAGIAWANAYQAYATGALSSAGSLPVGAPANLGMLVGAFQAGLSALSPGAAGGLVAQGILGYWQAMTWAGPMAAGVTAFAGNASLSGALVAIFTDLGRKSASQKAQELANAFDAGARAVVVSDVPFVQPAPPIVGPIV